MIKVKRELNATSSQDQFAKWAKLRRQHDKQQAEYDEKGEYISDTICCEKFAAKRLDGSLGLRANSSFRGSKWPEILQVDL